MFRRGLVIFCCAVSSIFSISPLSIYEIDPMNRGRSFVNIFSTLNTNYPSEVLIQTMATIPYLNSPYVVNGVIPYIKSIAPAPNYTLLLVTYFPLSATQQQYLVVPVEQITEMVYSPVAISPSGFMSTFLQNVSPLYIINPALRAADLAHVTTTLLTQSPYSTPLSQVWIQTNLSGPYYIPFINGIIPNVQSISAEGSLLRINYLNPSSVTLGSVVISVEQVQQIVYYFTNPNIR